MRNSKLLKYSFLFHRKFTPVLLRNKITSPKISEPNHWQFQSLPLLQKDIWEALHDVMNEQTSQPCNVDIDPTINLNVLGFSLIVFIKSLNHRIKAPLKTSKQNEFRHRKIFDLKKHLLVPQFLCPEQIDHGKNWWNHLLQGVDSHRSSNLDDFLSKNRFDEFLQTRH